MGYAFAQQIEPMATGFDNYTLYISYVIPFLFFLWLYVMCVGLMYASQRFLHTMRAIQGAVIASSSLQIILGFSGLWGILSRLAKLCLSFIHFSIYILYICIYFLGFLFHSKLNSKGGNNNRFLSPLGAAPSIALVGLGLFELGFPGVICFRFDKNLFRN